MPVKLMAGTGYWMSEGIGFAWARGISLPSDSINNMIRDLFTDDLARDFARDRALALDLARDLDRARAHARDLDLARDLDRDRAHTRAFDRALASASDRALARALDLDRALALDLALDFALALDLDRAFGRVHARALDLALALALALASASDRAHASDRAIALDFARARARDRAHKRDRTIKPISTAGEQRNNKEEAAFLLWYIRFSAQVLAVYLRYLLLIKSNSRTWIERLGNRSPDDDVIEGAISNYLDIYVTFALLEARIQGKLPAWEGILLVKERKKEN